MNYGFDETPSARGEIAGFIIGVVFGTIAGFFAELVAMGFTDSLAAAFPNAGRQVVIAIYLGLASLPALAFVGLARSRRARLTAKTIGLAGSTVLALLVAGELTGTVVLDRRHAPFAIVPAVERVPAKAAPTARAR